MQTRTPFARALACVCVLSAIFIGKAGAQTAATTTSAQGDTSGPDQLQEVVVTAKSIENELPQELSQYGTRVDTVTAQQILSGGYIDVAQALDAQTPGLYIASNAGPFNYVNVSLQGSRTEDVLWLVDDIPINNRLYAGTTPLDTIPASMIEQIQVLDGGQALYYGSQAVAGAVNIVTKSFTDHPDGVFSFGADSADGKHLNGYFRDELDSQYFVLYATHDESPGIQPYPSSDYQPSGTDRHRSYDVTTLGAKYGYKFTDNLNFSSLYQHTDATIGYPSPTVIALAYNQRDEDLVSTNLDYDPSDALKVDAQGYYHRWSSYYTEFDNGTFNSSGAYVPNPPGQLTVANNDDFWGYKDFGANLMAQVGLARGLLAVVGYDLDNYVGRDTVFFIPHAKLTSVNAVFAQLRTTPDLIAGLHLSAGLRYNNTTFGPSDTIWNTGAEYDFGPSMYLKANVGTAFRLPTDEELFANVPLTELGDPNLKAESSDNANVAIGGRIPMGAALPLHWEAMTFYRAIKNLIDYQSFDPTTQQEVFGNVPGTVRTIGEQLTLEFPITEWVSATASGTYSNARQIGTDYQFDQIPVSVTKAGLDYHPSGSRFGAGMTFERVGDLDDQPFGAGTQRIGYGDYSIMDLNGHVFIDQDHHQRIDLHINNVFNHIYYSGVGAATTDVTDTPYVIHNLAWPRVFQVNYTYSFQ